MSDITDSLINAAHLLREQVFVANQNFNQAINDALQDEHPLSSLQTIVNNSPHVADALSDLDVTMTRFLNFITSGSCVIELAAPKGHAWRTDELWHLVSVDIIRIRHTMSTLQLP